MNAVLQSDKVFLFDYRHASEGCPDELWQLLRKTTVEAAHASSLDFATFADECLLCARIVANESPATQNRTGGTPSLATPAEARIDVPSLSFPSTSSASTQAPLFENCRMDGFVYLHASLTNHLSGEANIGVVMEEGMRGRGYAREAVQLVLRWAFEEFQFHRVQAAILDAPFKDKALRLFIGSGLAHEGTKRRAVYQPEGEGSAGIWKDVTYLAMLDTEWMLRSIRRGGGHAPAQPVISLWDEMFTRHSSEREALLRWEEDHGRIRRSSSTDTVTLNERNAHLTEDMAYLTETSSISELSVDDSPPPSPSPNVIVTWDSDDDGPLVNANVEFFDQGRHNQRWEDVLETTLAARRHRQEPATGSLLAPSPLGRLLTLPSIPSIAMLSEGSLETPLTILSPSSAESSELPPSSPSPASSGTHSPWSNLEDNLFPASSPTNAAIRPRSRYSPYPLPRADLANLTRSRSRSSSVSSARSDSWSDAQSSVVSDSSTWDLLSNASDRSRRHV